MTTIPIARILRLHEEFVSAADYAALSDACERCKGRGYHHGFGEDGNDPDWCDTCGGTGEILDAERFDAAEISFITAGLTPVSPAQVEPDRGYKIADLLPILQAIASDDRDRWTWGRNSRCKYVTLAIDTRDGGYVRISDRDGNAITLTEFAYQFRGEPGTSAVRWIGERIAQVIEATGAREAPSEPEDALSIGRAP